MVYKAYFIVLFLIFSLELMGNQNQPTEVRYHAPSSTDWHQLSPEQLILLEEKITDLGDPSFINRPGLGIVRSSGYKDPRITEEAVRIARHIFEIKEKYSRIIFVGRSNTGIMNIVQGIFEKANVSIPVEDLPFSLSQHNRLTSESHAGIKRHLQSRELIAKHISQRSKPILFVDIIFEGKGVAKLSELILGTSRGSDAAKRNMELLGLFSPAGLAEMNLRKQEVETAAELRRAPKQITDQEIETEAKRAVIPPGLKGNFGKVHVINVNRDYFFYVGNQAPMFQESFSVSRWVAGGTLKTIPLSQQDLAHPGVLEAYYLFRIGKNLNFGSSLKSCADVMNP